MGTISDNVIEMIEEALKKSKPTSSVVSAEKRLEDFVVELKKHGRKT